MSGLFVACLFPGFFVGNFGCFGNSFCFDNLGFCLAILGVFVQVFGHGLLFGNSWFFVGNYWLFFFATFKMFLLLRCARWWDEDTTVQVFEKWKPATSQQYSVRQNT